MMTPTNEKKIALFLSSDLIGVLMANSLIPQLLASGVIPIILDAGLNRNRKPKAPAPADIDFYATKAMDSVILPYLDTADDVNAPNTSYKHIAEKYGIEHRFITNINAPDLIAQLTEEGCIGGLSMRQYQVFEKPMIDAMKKAGFIWNLHGGVLPDYKGFLAPYRAISNNETHYGWTLHEVDEGIDTGGIVAICEQPIVKAKQVLDMYLDLVPDAASMIAKAILEKIQTGTIAIKSNSGGAYYGYPTPAEMAAHARNGIVYVRSPMTYINKIIDLFSKAGTAHAMLLRNNLMQAIAEEFRPQEDIQKTGTSRRVA